MRILSTVCLLLAGSTGAALALDVERSVEIAQPPATVWAMAGPFCAIADWHPHIASCEELVIEDRLHRRLKTATDDALLERQIERDEAGMRYRYAIERSFLPVARYRATFAVEPAGAGSRIDWRADFTARGAADAAAEQAVAALHEAGLAGLKVLLERP